LEPEQIEAVPEKIEAFESRFVSRDVLANLPTGFGKIKIYPVFFFFLAKLSASNSTVSVLVISPLNSIVQVSEYNFSELGLSAIHLKD